jgi:hypothetical protein
VHDPELFVGIEVTVGADEVDVAVFDPAAWSPDVAGQVA